MNQFIKISMPLMTCILLCMQYSTTWALRAIPDSVACEDAGGRWNDCGSACNEFCVEGDMVVRVDVICTEQCVPQCECPDGGFFDGLECLMVDYPECEGISLEQVCNDAGGRWSECGGECFGHTCVDNTGNLVERDIVCSDECIPQCECPEGAMFDGQQCVVFEYPLCTNEEEIIACEEGGGRWNECGSDCNEICLDENGNIAPVDLLCNDVCVPQCECPLGQRFDGQQCVDFEIPVCDNQEEILACEAGGGIWSECLSCNNQCLNPDGSIGELNIACPQVCEIGCDCSVGQIFDGFNCVEAELPLCEEREDTEEEVACIEGGGRWNECASACDERRRCLPDETNNDAISDEAPEDYPVDCDTSCIAQCECPNGQFFDGESCVDLTRCGEEEGGSEAGSEAGSEGGSEAGSEGGSEAGSEGGSEAGNEGGSEAGSEEAMENGNGEVVEESGCEQGTIRGASSVIFWLGFLLMLALKSSIRRKVI